MAKAIRGYCDHCGHCGCYASKDSNPKWSPGIGGFALVRGLQHPDRDIPICTHIRGRFHRDSGINWQQGFYDFWVRISFPSGDDPIDVEAYVTERGIQKSDEDASCPFFELGSPNKCLLWGRPQLPLSCRNNPQNLTEEKDMEKWTEDHPPCKYYWVDV
jgi:hypothetical protein